MNLLHVDNKMLFDLFSYIIYYISFDLNVCNGLWCSEGKLFCGKTP